MINTLPFLKLFINYDMINLKKMNALNLKNQKNLKSTNLCLTYISIGIHSTANKFKVSEKNKYCW